MTASGLSEQESSMYWSTGGNVILDDGEHEARSPLGNVVQAGQLDGATRLLISRSVSREQACTNRARLR